MIIGTEKWNSFYKILDELHFYSLKAEGLFKIILLAVSCAGCIVIPSGEKGFDCQTAIVNLYLFSVALIMEFVVKLVVADSFISKIVPMLIVVPSIIAFIFSATKLLGKQLPFVTYEMAVICVVIPLVVIWIDVWIQILIEKPKKKSRICEILRDLEMEE